MSKQSDVDYYLESISIFYDEKIKFLSTKDNFLRCKGCPTNKEFKEEYDKVINIYWVPKNKCNNS